VVQINTGYNFCVRFTLGKYNAQMLLFRCVTLERISRAGLVLQVAFPIINVTILHNVFHFCLRNVPALHSAFCVLRVIKISDFSVESSGAGRLAPGLRAVVICVFAVIIQAATGTHKQQQCGKHNQKEKRSELLCHYQNLNGQNKAFSLNVLRDFTRRRKGTSKDAKVSRGERGGAAMRRISRRGAKENAKDMKAQKRKGNLMCDFSFFFSN
jgi:hypothetical protein